VLYFLVHLVRWGAPPEQLYDENPRTDRGKARKWGTRLPIRCGRLAVMSSDKPLGFFSGYLESLKSSQLVMFLTALFVLDLFIPDMLPFVDEAVLFLLTLLASRWQQRSKPAPAPKPPPKNVTPAGGR